MNMVRSRSEINGSTPQTTTVEQLAFESVKVEDFNHVDLEVSKWQYKPSLKGKCKIYGSHGRKQAFLASVTLSAHDSVALRQASFLLQLKNGCFAAESRVQKRD